MNNTESLLRIPGLAAACQVSHNPEQWAGRIQAEAPPRFSLDTAFESGARNAGMFAMVRK